jgi:hypothetical protein
MNNVIDNIDFNKKYKILSIDDYSITDDLIDDFCLSDISVSIYNGIHWVVFPIFYLYNYPIIYFTYYQKESDESKIKKIQTSLLFCLITSRCVLVNGSYKFIKYIDNRLILQNDDNKLLPIDLNLNIDPENNIIINKRYQIRINTLRNSLIEFQDIKYLHINHKHIHRNFAYYYNYLDYNSNLINDVYYHPKTLVYIITYLSKSNKYKNTIIVGNDVSKNNILSIYNYDSYKHTNHDTYVYVSGYDSRKSGFDDYVSSNHNELVEHDAFIMPMLFFMAKIIYPDAKIIEL